MSFVLCHDDRMPPRFSHRSGYDAWLVIVMASASAFAACAASGVSALTTARGSELYAVVVVFAFVAALSGLIAWIVFSIRYDITADALVVRYGSFRHTILLKDILEVEPTRWVMSVPAGSLRRLKVTFRRETWTAYSLISPCVRRGQHGVRARASCAPSAGMTLPPQRVSSAALAPSCWRL